MSGSLEHSATEEKVTFETGATRSKLATDWHLLPVESLRAWGARNQLGVAKHGPRNWMNGMSYEIVFSHAFEHLLAIKERLDAGVPFDDAVHDDDAGAIMWAGAAFAHFEGPRATPTAKTAFYRKAA